MIVYFIYNLIILYKPIYKIIDNTVILENNEFLNNYAFGIIIL
jgi:hypothetical protein